VVPLQAFGFLLLIYVALTAVLWERALPALLAAAGGCAGLVAAARQSISFAKLVLPAKILN
jgi:hypothetical protein